MRYSRLIIAIVLLAALTGGAFGSPAVTLPGKQEPERFFWKNRAIKIAVSSSLIKQNANIKPDSDVIGAVRRSLAAWQNATDIEFQVEPSERQSVSPVGISGDGVSLITIAPTPENVLFFAKDAQTVSAKTRLFYNRKGFITEADIVLNPFQQFSTDGSFGTFDLESALTHEIGHLLGLRHSEVMGSAMSADLAKNAALGAGEFAPRTLSDNDVAAIRELYGGKPDNDGCCAGITGKITSPSGRPGKNLKIWAEESATGRVIAQADLSADGGFSIGGLPGGTYELFWKTRAGQIISAAGELGKVQLANGETKTLNQKVTAEQTDIVVDYVGVDGQLAASAVLLGTGREQTVYIGGKNLDPKRLTIDLGSPFLHVTADSVIQRDFGKDLSVISFSLTVDRDAAKGVYSIFFGDSNGGRAVLVGALRVQ